MIIYVLSSPDDAIFLLTTANDVVRAALEEYGDEIVVQTWDTDLKRTCAIRIRLDDGEETTPAP